MTSVVPVRAALVVIMVVGVVSRRSRGRTVVGAAAAAE